MNYFGLNYFYCGTLILYSLPALTCEALKLSNAASLSLPLLRLYVNPSSSQFIHVTVQSSPLHQLSRHTVTCPVLVKDITDCPYAGSLFHLPYCCRFPCSSVIGEILDCRI